MVVAVLFANNLYTCCSNMEKKREELVVDIERHPVVTKPFLELATHFKLDL